MTSEGTSWHICERDLEIWEGDGWRKAGVAREFSKPRYGAVSGRPYISFGKTGRGEILYHVGAGDLLQLAAQPDGTFRLDSFAYSAVNPGGLFDAVADGPGQVLLAAVHGLFLLHTETGRLDAIASPELPAKIRSLCRDARGRLWAAGDKLHLSTDNGKNWELVDLPMLSRNWPRVRPDPENPRGMILTLYNRGVVFLE